LYTKGIQEDLLQTKAKTVVSVLTSQSVTVMYNVLQVIFSLILIRILEPMYFGLFAPLFALLYFFIDNVLMGQGPLFIRKKSYEAGHFIQVITINAILATMLIEACAGLLLFISPQAPHMVRILFIALLPGVINMGFIYLGTERLERYKLFVAWMADIISYGLSTIFFALNNYGVYSFIYATIISKIFFFIFALALYKKDIFTGRIITIKQYAGYIKEGFVFNLTYLAGSISDYSDRVILTRFISPTSLGLYSIAIKYSFLFNNFILDAMESVVYPLYSKFKDNIDKIKKIHRNFTMMTFALIIPFNSFVFVFSKDIIRIVAGEKWLGAAPLVSVFSFFYLTKAAQYFMHHILWAKGKEATTLIQLITRAVLFLSTGTALSFKYGVYGFIIAYFVQGCYDSVFYYIALKELRKQILRNIRIVVSIFAPIFILFNIIGKTSNMYIGILTLLIIYALFAKYIFIPFIKEQFGVKIKDFFAILINKAFKGAEKNP